MNNEHCHQLMKMTMSKLLKIPIYIYVYLYIYPTYIAIYLTFRGFLFEKTQRFADPC